MPLEAPTFDPSTHLTSPNPPPAAPGKSFWTWTIVACSLLVGSGVARVIQERRHLDEKSFIETCPFPLKEIPKQMGVWKMKDGGEHPLDAQTMLITGGTDHISRVYVDELTGVRLSVLVLFGPAEPVMPHTPEICYPSSGFGPAQNSMMRAIPYTTRDPSGREVPREALYRSSVYEKTGGLITRRQEAFHSFRLEDQWSPDVAAGRKFPRRNPGVFKVQVQRSVAANENRDRENPIDQFLSLLIPEIERRIEASGLGKRVAAR